MGSLQELRIVERAGATFSATVPCRADPPALSVLDLRYVA